MKQICITLCRALPALSMAGRTLMACLPDTNEDLVERESEDSGLNE